MKVTTGGHACRPYLEGGDPGIQEQTLDMLRVLLDSEACRDTPPENDKFLEVFYAENMNKLVAVVNGCTERCGPTVLLSSGVVSHQKRDYSVTKRAKVQRG
jgi:hypothetical protein